MKPRATPWVTVVSTGKDDGDSTSSELLHLSLKAVLVRGTSLVLLLLSVRDGVHERGVGIIVEDGDPRSQIGPKLKRALRVKVGRGSRVHSHNVLDVKLEEKRKGV